MDHAPSRRFDVLPLLVGAALAAMLLMRLGELTFVDTDMFHEMSLAREATRVGRLPTTDDFAYTQTHDRIVHQEWGAGMIFYAVASLGGAEGILCLKYALVAAIAWACVRCAGRSGADYRLLLWLAPAAMVLGDVGLTTIRAQVFSLLATAILLNLLELDRGGRRGWIWIWPAVHLVWLNLHAGFVVGVLYLVLYIVERMAHSGRVRHVVTLVVACLALIAVNPYGMDYYAYLVGALTLNRTLIGEWAPLRETTDLAQGYVYGLSLLLLAYGWWQQKRLVPAGGLLVIASALAAWQHTRHLSLYAVTWLCCAPALIAETPLGALLRDVVTRRRTAFSVLSVIVLAVCLTRGLAARPWRLQVPCNVEDARAGRPVYPVGAVDYLEQVGFNGNVLTPFAYGAYVSWRLYPQVRVSLDGRYEVAFPPSWLVQQRAIYHADDNWRSIFDRWPTDAALIRANAPLAEILPAEPGWEAVYRDDVYVIVVRSERDLPQVDRTGQTLHGSFEFINTHGSSRE